MIGTTLTLAGPRSTGVDVAEASAKPGSPAAASAGVAAALTGTDGNAISFGPWGITRSMAALATTPKTTAPAAQPSETTQNRINFIVNPTLPLRQQCGIRVKKRLPGSDIITRIWWQHPPWNHVPLTSPHPTSAGGPGSRPRR